VFLDDVQFERRSWQSRNRILLDGHEQLLTVPVRKTSRDTRIDRIELGEDDAWRQAHSRVLESAYSKAPWGRDALGPVLKILANRSIVMLADLNICIIEAWKNILGLTVKTYRASTLGCGGARSKHLALICDAVGSRAYLSPAGSLPYLTEDCFESAVGINLRIQSFQPQPYPQRRADSFVSHLSLIDVLAHLGPEAARRYIQGETL